jgi:uncharacterized protein (TIGR03067 family)
MAPTLFKSVPALLLTAATLSAAPAPVPKDRPGQDRKRIQGTWRAVRVEANGKHLHREVCAGQVWVFTDSRLTVRYPDGTEETFAYELGPTRKPKEIDLRPAGPLTRSSFQGIYSLPGDRLAVCRARGRRPSSLAPGHVERGEILFLLERVRK